MSLYLPADLTVAQDAIWRDQQLFPGRPIYNTGQVLSIEGELHFDLFERALRQTVAESPCLRLAPRSAPLHFTLPLLDFREQKNPSGAAEQWMRDEMRRAIPLEDPVLFRFALLRITSTHTLWFQKYHHIIMDATARRLVSARTAAHYRALRFGDPRPSSTLTHQKNCWRQNNVTVPRRTTKLTASTGSSASLIGQDLFSR